MGILKVVLFFFSSLSHGKSVYSYLGPHEDISNYICVNNQIRNCSNPVWPIHFWTNKALLYLNIGEARSSLLGLWMEVKLCNPNFSLQSLKRTVWWFGCVCHQTSAYSVTLLNSEGKVGTLFDTNLSKWTEIQELLRLKRLPYLMRQQIILPLLL